MTRLVSILASGAMGASMFVAPLVAQKPATPAADGQRPKACGILPREELKKIMPWGAAFDPVKETEEPYGTGSVCSYPGFDIFVGKYSQSTLDFARKRGPLLPVAGVGDEAFLREDGRTFAHIYVKVGDRIVQVQKSIRFDETFESVKPALIAMGKALAAKLR